MRTNSKKSSLIRSGLAASLLLLASGLSFAQSVNLTAAPTQAVLPDGQTVPMWGYSCTGTATDATCVAANPTAGANWSPVLITVPYNASGTSLTINLTNQLPVPPGGTGIPTSLTIVGQLGGGLGTPGAFTPSPDHSNAQTVTWPAADPTTMGAPPTQGPRVRSFATEVPAGNTETLVWSNLKPGTYLIESGTHPSIQGPMGLYGVLVVTQPPVSNTTPGTAYPGVNYSAEVPLLLSEIDPAQNRAVAAAVATAGFSETKVWSGQTGKCGDLSETATAEANTCYPPAVNYDPRYYLINGTAFNAANPGTSVFGALPAGTGAGSVLVRFVNAGLRMHVPTIVGALTNKLTTAAGGAATSTVVPGLALIAEDGNVLPGVTGSSRIQNEVFLAAGKTYDVMINGPIARTLPVFDRQLSLSTNNQRNGGMLAYVTTAAVDLSTATGVTSAAALLPAGAVSAAVNPDTYYVVPGATSGSFNPLVVSDPSKGLIANDVGIVGVAASGAVPGLTLNPNGTFTYTGGPRNFTYCGNGSATLCATVTIAECTGTCLGSAPVATPDSYASTVASRLQISPPGVLLNDTDPSGLPLTASAPSNVTGGSVTLNPDGSFTAIPACAPTCTAASNMTFQYTAVNSQNTASTSVAVTLTFPAPSNIAVNVRDAVNNKPISDYRWIIEEDKTFWIDPKCQVNVAGTRVDSTGRACPALPVESLGYNFHTANMPVVASGCVGPISCEAGQTLLGAPARCDVGNGICVADSDPSSNRKADLVPGQVALDPSKRYYISILPGDGVNTTIGGTTGPTNINGKDVPFDIARDCGPYDPAGAHWIAGGPSGGPPDGFALCGHAMGGAQIGAAPGAGTLPRPTVNISLQQTPLPTAKIAVFVFEDDNPLNGENDAGGGVDVIAPNEPGLGGFEIKLFDQAGGLGDATGQITYDMFNMPVSNSLAGTKDPVTGFNACPIARNGAGNIVGMIPTCPKYEDGVDVLGNPIESPLAGQAVIANLYPGLYEIVATPAADRIARGEEWLQTNTLDGGKAHEAFIKANEPGYFQEFGPGGFHVSIGFANPKIINARKAALCANQTCTSTLNVQVASARMSRTPDQRIYSSRSYDAYSFTQCYVSLGPPDGEDFAFEKCSPDGTVTFTGLPKGDFKLTVFDQWNDIMLDGLVSPVTVDGSTVTKEFPVTQWRTNLYTRTFIDTNGDGVSQPEEAGLPLVSTNIRYRDGSFGFFNNTDLNGYAGFNEVFPFMNWLVVESDTTRYKPTGTHVVYDAGGAADGTTGGGTSSIADHIANTIERVSLPAELRVPGARYCANADCPAGDTAGGSTGRVDPPSAGSTQGWQGLLGQNSFIEFGVKPFAPGENGGIKGHVIYASTRPFDDPALLLQLSWEPGVPNVKINLYQEGIAPDGTTSLKLVDTTTSSSWDAWAQGFRSNGVPNMNCPGQDATSPFFATLKDSKLWLDPTKTPLPNHSQFKCYDGWSQLNQIQPAPYDGMYKFPSVTAINPTTGAIAGSNCTICATNSDGSKTLPPGKYVVEVIVPPGYELVKEEDKNILLGDVYIAPVSQQFAGLGNIFIMPDQAAVNAYYNKNNSINPTTNLGAAPRHEGDTGSIEAFWPCVGAMRIVPDFNSLFPTAGQNAPFAGARRPLCDRKEVVLEDQMSVLAKFYIFSSTHIAGHFTGTITNDFASEFDPFSPQFGEKFGPPNLPVGLRDFSGNEMARVYSDQWGIYNGLYFSSYGVNPPNPTGYVPQMSIACMNDPGPIPKTNDQGQFVDASNNVVASADLAAKITDPAYSPAYSNFCYETPFMPGFTAYMDTPVIPTMAFADGYNLPDSEYPDGTPAILQVVNTDTSVPGPWLSLGTAAARATVTLTFANVSNSDNVSSVVVGTTPTTTTLTGGTITCNTASACSALNQNGRNARMATLIAASINARTGTTGYSATAATNTVTITAPVGTGSELNGISVTVNQTGVNVTPAAAALAGGASASSPSLGLTITALGDKVVQNPNYSGPNATTAPYNQKAITRHYGFGASQGTVALVGSDGVSHPLIVGTWSDTTISASLDPTSLPPACAVQQRNTSQALCGELVITTAAPSSKRSIDAVTVTIGGKAPTFVTPASPSSTAFGRNFPNPLQTAIDNAAPGDLIIVGPGTYKENLLMWKPVRLQGVGAGAVVINADAHPAGKMDPWRRQVNCLFGLTIDGATNPNNLAYDPNGVYTCPASMFLRVDRIPFEGFVGWDAASNGNLAQVLQEPSLMGAYEGAGVTVLGRGVLIPANSQDFWGQPAQGGAGGGAFPDGSRYLSSSNTDCTASLTSTNGRDYGTSNFQCNPSRIDGVSVINSSQGGGGIFMHGWQHNMEIGNNRIYGNHGTLAGGINLGNGETPPLYTNDGTICGPGVAAPAPLCPPIGANSLIGAGTPAANAAIPAQLNTRVRVHHNMIINNASIGDALFSGTPSGAGGITVSAGSDRYTIDHNWVAGNLSSGDGGGVQQAGLSFNGRIANNWILFNQTTNPTLPTNGGGLSVVGANSDRLLPDGTECGATTDVDCPPGIGDGTGPGLVIDANLILGNSAESGSGGGMRLQQVNGTEVGAFPINSERWYDVTITNNIIANNVAGWDGGGVSMQDALKVSFINNTVVSNDTTASAGVLFKTLGAINSSAPPPGCTPTPNPNDPQNPLCLIPDAPHNPQPAGLVTMAHTPNLVDSLPGIVNCPAGFGYQGGVGTLNADCVRVSRPLLVNDMFFQNRSFQVDIVGPGAGLQSQQNLVALTPLLNQATTGACPAGANFWDVGVRGDLGPTDHSGAGALALTNSILTSTSGVGGTGNFSPSASPVIAQFCNGARVPPENCASQLDQATCKGYNAPPGRSETTGLSPVFVFNGITPAATVDEGHNWLNLTYGPLTLSRATVVSPTNHDAPELMVAAPSVAVAGGAYSIAGTSPAVNRGIASGAPATDYFGNPRNSGGAPDVGAVEFQVASGSTLVVANPAPLLFSNIVVGAGSVTRDLVLSNNGTTAFTLTSVVLTTGFTRVTTGSFTNLPLNCGATLAGGASCTIRVQWTPGAVPATATGIATITGSAPVTNSPVAISANSVAANRTARVSAATLAFGTWPTGVASARLSLTVTNTGNADLAGGTFVFGGGTPQPFARPLINGGTCTAALAVGASCTINVTFTPPSAGPFSRTLTVAYTGGTTVTNATVSLTGTGVATRASVAVTPTTITLLSPDVSISGSLTSTGVVTLTNTAPTGGASLTVTGVAISQPTGTAAQYLFNLGPLAGPDNCTGAAIGPGQSCTVTVRFTNLTGARGPTRSGTITFTDTGAGSPHTATVSGIATP